MKVEWLNECRGRIHIYVNETTRLATGKCTSEKALWWLLVALVLFLSLSMFLFWYWIRSASTLLHLVPFLQHPLRAFAQFASLPQPFSSLPFPSAQLSTPAQPTPICFYNSTWIIADDLTRTLSSWHSLQGKTTVVYGKTKIENKKNCRDVFYHCRSAVQDTLKVFRYLYKKL